MTAQTIEAAADGFSETSITLYKLTVCHIPKDLYLQYHPHWRKSLQSKLSNTRTETGISAYTPSAHLHLKSFSFPCYPATSCYGLRISTKIILTFGWNHHLAGRVTLCSGESDSHYATFPTLLLTL